MAHLIDETTGKPAIAYYGETPWHSLGTQVDEAMSSKEAIVLGGLDWEVRKETIFDALGNIIESHKVVKRSDTGAVLGVVGNRYQPLQNFEAFEFADSLVDEGRMKYHVVGALDGGKKIWLLAKLPGTIQVIGHDTIDQYFLFTNGHDGNRSVAGALTNIRVVCDNTLRMAEIGAKYLFRARHTGEVKEKIENARELFYDVNKRAQEFKELAQRMVLTPCLGDATDRFIREALGYGTDTGKKLASVSEKRVEKVKELVEVGAGADIPGVKGTLWGAYNAVAEYTDHFQAIRGDEIESRLNSAWFGAGRETKDRALRIATNQLV